MKIQKIITFKERPKAGDLNKCLDCCDIIDCFVLDLAYIDLA